MAMSAALKRKRSDPDEDEEHAKKLHQCMTIRTQNALSIALQAIRIAEDQYRLLLLNANSTTQMFQDAGVAIESAWSYHNRLLKSVQNGTFF